MATSAAFYMVVQLLWFCIYLKKYHKFFQKKPNLCEYFSRQEHASFVFVPGAFFNRMTFSFVIERIFLSLFQVGSRKWHNCQVQASQKRNELKTVKTITTTTTKKNERSSRLFIKATVFVFVVVFFLESFKEIGIEIIFRTYLLMLSDMILPSISTLQCLEACLLFFRAVILVERDVTPVLFTQKCVLKVWKLQKNSPLFLIPAWVC